MINAQTTTAALTVFHEGQELENAAVWKNRQLLGNHLTTLLAAIIVIAEAAGYNVPLTPEQITIADGAIAALVGIVNSLLTIATSSRIGIKPRGAASNIDNVEIIIHDPTKIP